MPNQKWKDKNYNSNLKVSSATVAKLKKGTKASNMAAAAKPGASVEFKEAVRRFYGKNTVAFKAPAQAQKAMKSETKKSVTPNDREGRKSVATVKPTGGPGAKPVKVSPPKGGPGSKPRASKGQTPNQREGRKTMSSPKPTGGPGSKMPKAPRGGPGAKGR